CLRVAHLLGWIADGDLAGGCAVGHIDDQRRLGRVDDCRTCRTRAVERDGVLCGLRVEAGPEDRDRAADRASTWGEVDDAERVSGRASDRRTAARALVGRWVLPRRARSVRAWRAALS